MKNRWKCAAEMSLMLAIAMRVTSGNAEELSKTPPPVRGLQEIRPAQVKLRGGFWGPRLKTAHEVTVPHALNELEKDGHVTNFDKAAGTFNGPLKGHHAFDSDLYKAVEGALYSLEQSDDPALKQRVAGIIERILAAQQKDGFLITYFIVNGLDKRWEDLRLEHQMYNAGHFFEMAVQEQHVFGASKGIDAAKRFADHIDSVFGPGKRYDVDGHQEVELALIKLYRATGERRYLDLAKFFLDERGYAHGTERKPFDPKSAVMPVREAGKVTPEQQREFWHARLRVRNGRMQDHKPVVDQLEAVGHAVRAGYMYSAMADMLRFREAPGYEKALDHLWNDVVTRKIYLTGNIGTGQYDDEGFGDPYLLPNNSAYCESCAAIANVLWQHRMNLLKADAKYADVMELALYNGVLSGMSLSGNKFFYQNPLASGGAERRSWIGLACCPSNLARLIPQVGGFAYAQGSNTVYVNLYAAGEVSLKMSNGVTAKLAQQTDYPWSGNVRLTVNPTEASAFTVCLRIPGWVTGQPFHSDLYRVSDMTIPVIGLTLNSEKIVASPSADGYIHLQRNWKAGDVVELSLPMPAQRLYAHEKVMANQGKVALMRGPIVYCLEAVDHPGVALSSLALPKESELFAEYRADVLGGVTVLSGKALSDGHPVSLTAVPYYAWANRAKGAMAVWMQEMTKQPPPAVLPGATADPHIAVFGTTFCLYPTSDGPGWNPTSFHGWTSTDLKHWKDEGAILDFPRDLTWAKGQAWAPAIATKNGKYYFYYSANQNIGVAVSDHPMGPFKDPLGKPLVAKGEYRCQAIDPMVFVDDDGSAYLYFGQGKCMAVKLNDDMISFDHQAAKAIQPQGYNEGAFVHKRKGIYYLSWSEFDTRDPRYSVAYATSSSPLGPYQKALANPILQRKGEIKAAGHHSIVQIPGRDAWVVAYHRFHVPGGSGTNRETCLSPLRFDDKGAILPVDIFEPVPDDFILQTQP